MSKRRGYIGRMPKKQTKNKYVPLFLDRENIGTATQVYDTTEGTDMAVVTTGDAAISQSFQRATYYGGKSQLIELTFSSGHNQTNVLKRVGYFTGNNMTIDTGIILVELR